MGVIGIVSLGAAMVVTGCRVRVMVAAGAAPPPLLLVLVAPAYDTGKAGTGTPAAGDELGDGPLTCGTASDGVLVSLLLASPPLAPAGGASRLDEAGAETDEVEGAAGSAAGRVTVDDGGCPPRAAPALLSPALSAWG